MCAVRSAVLRYLWRGKGRRNARTTTLLHVRSLGSLTAGAVILVLSGAGVASAAQDPNPVIGAGNGTDPAKGPSSQESLRDPLVQESEGLNSEASRAAEQRRKPDEGIQERLASKSAFRELSREQAHALYRQAFPKVAERRAWKPLRGFAEPDVDILSAYSAVVRTDASRPGQLLTSVGVPLAIRTDDGFKAVDASLDTQQDAYRPRSSVVDTRIGRQSATGLTIDQVTMKLLDAGDVSGVEEDDKVFFANVFQDTDLVVATTPTGVETFSQLRSPDSPEEECFAIDMPAHAVLRATDDGGAEVVSGDQRLATIHPPRAADAQGRNVPVDIKVEGNVLLVTTHHRDGDFAYPERPAPKDP